MTLARIGLEFRGSQDHCESTLGERGPVALSRGTQRLFYSLESTVKSTGTDPILSVSLPNIPTTPRDIPERQEETRAQI